MTNPYEAPANSTPCVIPRWWRFLAALAGVILLLLLTSVASTLWLGELPVAFVARLQQPYADLGRVLLFLLQGAVFASPVLLVVQFVCLRRKHPVGWVEWIATAQAASYLVWRGLGNGIPNMGMAAFLALILCQAVFLLAALAAGIRLVGNWRTAEWRSSNGFALLVVLAWSTIMFFELFTEPLLI